MTGEIGFRLALCPPRNQLEPAGAQEVHAVLEAAGVSGLYPDFDTWYLGRVAPGLRCGERRIFTRRQDGDVIGIAIAKLTATERKLCTLWVAPQARGRGVATELARDAFAWLGTARPFFTVPQECVEDFAGLLRSWSFPGPIAYADAYRPAAVEYAFNGRLGAVNH